jgi:hypothetical protein
MGGLSPKFFGKSSELSGGLFTDFATNLPQSPFAFVLYGNPPVGFVVWRWISDPGAGSGAG